MPVITGLVDTYQVPTNARDVSKAFMLLQPEETKLFNRIEMGPMAEATTHVWWDDSRQVRGTKLNAGYTSGGGSFTVLSTAGARVGMLVVVNGKVYKITTVTDATHLAIAVANGGADANQANGSLVTFLGTASKEGKDYEDSDYTPEIARENVTQIMDDYLRVSGTQQSVKKEVNDGDEIARQALAKLKRLYLFLARAIWTNPLVKPTDNNSPRIMGGIDYFIRTNGYVPAAAAFSADNFDAFILEMENRGAAIGEVWMNPTQQKAFSALDSDKQQNPRGDRKRGTFANTYYTQYGHEITLNTDPQAPLGGIYLFRTEQVKFCPLMGRQFQVLDVAKTGDADKKLLIGEYTLEVWNSAQMGIFTPT